MKKISLAVLLCHPLTAVTAQRHYSNDGSAVTQVSQTGASAVPEDKKGNIWTARILEINEKVCALSRFDQKSLYDKKPAATQIMLGSK